MKVRSIGKRGGQERLYLLRFLWVAMDAIEAMTVLRNRRKLSVFAAVSYPRKYCNIYAYTVEHIQWSISTRDKLGTGTYTVKPLYKGQVGDGSFDPYTVESFYKGRVLCPLYSGVSLQGTSWDRSYVPYTVESLYKGQVGDRSFVPYTVEPLYKGQVGDGSFVPYTVEPLYKGQVGGGSFVPYTVESLIGDRSYMSLIQWSLFTRDKLSSSQR